MTNQEITNIFLTNLKQKPQGIKRCAVGIGNEVYIVECEKENYIFRCSEEENAYAETVHWLTRLSELDIPIPKILFHGTHEKYQYLIHANKPKKQINQEKITRYSHLCA